VYSSTTRMWLGTTGLLIGAILSILVGQWSGWSVTSIGAMLAGAYLLGELWISLHARSNNPAQRTTQTAATEESA